VLAPASPAEGPIRQGESRSFVLPLESGQYVRVAVEQQGIEVELALLGPEGQTLARGGPISRRGWQVLSLVSRTAGTYLLRLSAPTGATGTGGRYRLALAERRSATPRDPPRVAAQGKLAQGLRARDQDNHPNAALPALTEALRLFRKAGDAEGEIDTTIEIGATEIYLKHPEEARQQFERALGMAGRARYARGQADAWNDLAVTYSWLRQPEKALEAYGKAIELWRSIGDTVEQAHTLYALGYLYFRSYSDLDQADRLFAEALRLEHAAGDQGGEAYALTGRGLVARDRGDLETALKDFATAKQLCRQAGDRVLEKTLLGNMADSHFTSGRLQEALQLYEESLAGGGPADLYQRDQILHNLASLYFELGEPDKALARYQGVLAQQENDPASAAMTLNSIGTVLSAMGEPAKAGEDFARALKISRDARNAKAEALSLHNLGKLHLDSGELERALQELTQALALRRQLSDLTGQARTLLEIGTVQSRLHLLERAGASLRQALKLARSVDARSLVARCLLRQATLDRDRGDLKPARQEIEEALKVVETVRSGVGSDDLRTSFFAAKRQYYDFKIDLFMRLAERQPGAGYEAQALQASEEARARGLRDLLAEGRIDLNRGVDPERKRRADLLARELASTEEQLRRARLERIPNPSIIRQLADRLSALDGQQQVVIGEIRSLNPRYFEVRYPPPLDARSMAKGLDDQTALLEYAVGQERTFLFVVTRGGLRAYRLPQGAGALAERVRRLREGLESPGRSHLGSYIEDAAELYRDLIAPAEGSLAGKQALLISPDGILHLLPFEALLTAVPPAGQELSHLPFLLLRHSIAYVPSAGVLESLRAPRPPPAAARAAGAKDFIAFANPFYGPRGEGSPELPPLPKSEIEVGTIAGLFPPAQVQLYQKREATKDRVIGNPLVEETRRLHFAVHGILNEQWPQLSALVLARGRGQEDDGYLRVNEIFNLKLKADLVVLSACDTGGAQVDGEGLVGLTRAFFYAGASSLVVSLWQAYEDSTPELMANFYRQLALGKAEALRAAKRKMIEGGLYAHPFYWAPFVLVGEPR
jgi:CHAT domain-containing protein/Tfp pilus assembly protein PilF